MTEEITRYVNNQLWREIDWDPEEGLPQRIMGCLVLGEPSKPITENGKTS